MTATLLNLAPDNTTDAAFRAWGKAISDQLTAFGLTKTNDTGQIDWSTVTRPLSNQATPQGYEVRQLTDSLQATSPIFFKIEYGGFGGAPTPAIWLSFGTATNGAGALSGNFTTRQQLATNVSGTTPYSSILSGSINRLTLALFMGGTGGFFVTFERTKDINGNDTGEGLLITYLASGNSIRLNQFFPRSGLIPASQDVGVFQPLGTTSGLDGADVNYYPNFLFRLGTPLNPGITHLAYFNNDVVAGNQASISVYNINRNYYFIGNIAPVNGFVRGGVTTLGLSAAILYE